ncbi:MAG: hypothetical protein HAW62_05130 [Endozoicomonadaceae bacterium]|nr:hypothetical protein [Endozoicomonadaceae bacterium]
MIPKILSGPVKTQKNRQTTTSQKTHNSSNRTISLAQSTHYIKETRIKTLWQSLKSLFSRIITLFSKSKVTIQEIPTQPYIPNNKQMPRSGILYSEAELAELDAQDKQETLDTSSSRQAKKEEKERKLSQETNTLNTRYNCDTSNFPKVAIISPNNVIYSYKEKKSVLFLDLKNNQMHGLVAGQASTTEKKQNLQPVISEETKKPFTIQQQQVYINTITRQIVTREQVDAPQNEAIVTEFQNYNDSSIISELKLKQSTL